MWTKKELIQIKEVNENAIKELVITVKKLKGEKTEEIEKLKEGNKWRDDRINELENKIEEQNEVIADLKNLLDEQKAKIKRQDKLLTEHDLYEKKIKEINKDGGIEKSDVVKRMCRLEAKIEAQQNPYFF